MRFIAFVILIVLAPPALSSGLTFERPPARFVHEPTIPVDVYRLPPQAIRDACDANGHRRIVLGCAYRHAGLCNIFMVDDIHGRLLADMMEHEKAHCNGWTEKHER